MTRVEADVLVAGAGPAGSTAAALLAREGRRVVLVEKERFPRYHIGESLLPGVLPFLDELGVREQVEALGFHRKTGQTFVWGRDRTPWRLDFGELDAYPYAYFVERADFDRALLENARRLGATVLEEHALERFTDEDGRLAGAEVRGPEGELSIRARYTIDASGQSALIGRRLRLRRFQRRLKNLAVWSYWKGASHLPAPEDEHIFTISIAEGWIWLIPLRDGVTSAGIVTHSSGKKASDADLAPWYLRTLESCEPAWELLRGAERTEPVRAQRDWSYRCARFHGPGWLLAGDAACFVDPILSTGVNLAMNGGYLAALAVHSALDEPANEAAFLRYFQTAYRTLFAEQLESIKHFYRVEARRDSIYWKSKQLLRADLKLDGSLAFLLLNSGLARHATARDPHDVPSQTRSLLASHLDAPSSERASRPEPACSPRAAARRLLPEGAMVVVEGSDHRYYGVVQRGMRLVLEPARPRGLEGRPPGTALLLELEDRASLEPLGTVLVEEVGPNAPSGAQRARGFAVTTRAYAPDRAAPLDAAGLAILAHVAASRATRLRALGAELRKRIRVDTSSAWTLARPPRLRASMLEPPVSAELEGPGGARLWIVLRPRRPALIAPSPFLRTRFVDVEYRFGTPAPEQASRVILSWARETLAAIVASRKDLKSALAACASALSEAALPPSWARVSVRRVALE